MSWVCVEKSFDFARYRAAAHPELIWIKRVIQWVSRIAGSQQKTVWLPRMSELLRVSRLCFAAGGRQILAGLDLVIGEPEIHALLGANGSGKSTLAYLIMGCSGYVPDAGEIILRGTDLLALPMHERARLGVSLAWQEPARFEGLRVRDYLRLGSAHRNPAECLRRVGLAPEEYLDRAVDKTLSGGQRKRVELAAAFALEPALAMLDEPTAGVDLFSLDEIAQLILEFKRDGASVLLITHRQEIARLADRASHLAGGQIVCTGDAATVAAEYRARPRRTIGTTRGVHALG